ncbi:MAG: hypothetical protein HY043_00625 [Verrucomicrobia bacterium]|nr:hypothetical protein [Verrucomicrobiota bacterium]
MKTTLLMVGFFLRAATFAQSAPFINLDFESANIEHVAQPPLGGGGPLEELLPGWQLNGRSNGLFGLNLGCSDEVPTCATLVSLAGLQFPDEAAFFPRGLHGNFGVGLRPVPNFAFTLSQRGDVPVGAKYLFLDAQVSLYGNAVAYLDGVRVTTQIINFTNATDISAFAGKTVNLELRFGAFQQSPGPSMPPATIGLDAVVFLVPPKLEAPSSSPGTNGFTLSWTNDVSTRYQVEFATNFPATWKPIGAPVASTNGNFTFTDTTVTNRLNGQRFYRLRLAP